MNENKNKDVINPEPDVEGEALNSEDISDDNLPEKDEEKKEDKTQKEQENQGENEEYDMLHEDKEEEKKKEKKEEEKEEKPPFKQRFLNFLRKLPAYVIGAAYGIVGIARWLVQAVLYGPSYTAKHGDDLGKKLDEIKEAEGIKRQNEAAKEKEVKNQEKDGKENPEKENPEEEKSKDEAGNEERNPEQEIDVNEEIKETEEEPEQIEEKNGEGQEENKDSDKKKTFVDSMTKDDVEKLLSSDESQEFMDQLEEAGARIIFSPDYSTIKLCALNEEGEEKRVSRPVNMSSFLKGDVSELAIACKDIDYKYPFKYEDAETGEVKEMDMDTANNEAVYMLSAAKIGMDFRADNLQNYQAGDNHKMLRNNESLSYISVSLDDGSKFNMAIKGQSVDKGVAGYVATAIVVTDAENTELTIQSRNDGVSIMGDSGSIQYAIDALSDGSVAVNVMNKIESKADFPKIIPMSEEQSLAQEVFENKLNDGTTYATLGENDQKRTLEIIDEINEILDSAQYGFSPEQAQNLDKLLREGNEIMDSAALADPFIDYDNQYEPKSGDQETEEEQKLEEELGNEDEGKGVLTQNEDEQEQDMG